MAKVHAVQLAHVLTDRIKYEMFSPVRATKMGDLWLLLRLKKRCSV